MEQIIKDIGSSNAGSVWIVIVIAIVVIVLLAIVIMRKRKAAAAKAADNKNEMGLLHEQKANHKRSTSSLRLRRTKKVLQ